VPGATNTVSPLWAALMAAPMVRYRLGTCKVTAACAAGATTVKSAAEVASAAPAAIVRFIYIPD
jgi:hypothetical protein